MTKQESWMFWSRLNKNSPITKANVNWNEKVQIKNV